MGKRSRKILPWIFIFGQLTYENTSVYTIKPNHLLTAAHTLSYLKKHNQLNKFGMHLLRQWFLIRYYQTTGQLRSNYITLHYQRDFHPSSIAEQESKLLYYRIPDPKNLLPGNRYIFQ